MPEFIDKSGVNKADGSCCGIGDSIKDPDPTSNIENCYHSSNSKCVCSTGSNYKEDLVKNITRNVLEE